MKRTQSNKDFQILCRMLTHLLDYSIDRWNRNLDLDDKPIDEETSTNYYSICDRRPQMRAEKLDKLITESKKGKLEFDWLFLPPLDENKDFVPILSVKCDLHFGNSTPLCLRVMMVRPIHKRGLEGIGFRFEIGERGKNHHYHHMQFTAKPFGFRVDGLPVWMPETYPCVIIPSRCPVSLLFSMLISLYGKKSRKIIHGVKFDKMCMEPFNFILS